MSRNRAQPLLRNVNPSQYVLRPMPSSGGGGGGGGDNTWEATFKQAQDIIIRSSTGALERESNGANRRQRSISPPSRDDPTAKRRRRSPSTEDEVERRHRLAFDAAPWNSSRGDRAQPSQPLSRNRDGEPFSYRDREDRVYNRRTDANGDPSLNTSKSDIRRRSRYSPDELHSSSSHSSFESRRYHTSKDSPQRRLPYDRPSFEERSRYVGKFLFAFVLWIFIYFLALFSFRINSRKIFIFWLEFWRTFGSHSKKVFYKW